MISDRNLFTQSELDIITKAYLKEYYKNHSKASVNVLYTPYLQIGQTISLTDSYNNITDKSYFIESIGDMGGNYSLTLAYYP